MLRDASKHAVQCNIAAVGHPDNSCYLNMDTGRQKPVVIVISPFTPNTTTHPRGYHFSQSLHTFLPNSFLEVFRTTAELPTDEG